MAPEQLEGRPADTRTDIFAFGAVLYEMLAGRKAFEGKSRAALIGAILKDDPPPMMGEGQLADSALDRVVRRCLAKDPDDRWQSAADLTSELQWVAAHPGRPARLAVRGGAFDRHYCRSVRRGRRHGVVADASRTGERQAASCVGGLPEGTSMFPVSPTSRFALSPDGQRLAFVASRADGRPRLFVRALDSQQSQEIPGTEGALLPFWSPDSRSVGFIADGSLKRMDLGGSSVRTLARAAAGAPAAWSRDGVILFTPTRTSGLHRIPASGGDSRPVTAPDPQRNEVAHVAPHFLPDGRHFFYLALTRTASGRSVAGGTYVSDLDATGPPKLVLAEGSNVAYAAGIFYSRATHADGTAFRQSAAGADRRPGAGRRAYDTGWLLRLWTRSGVFGVRRGNARLSDGQPRCN